MEIKKQIKLYVYAIEYICAITAWLFTYPLLYTRKLSIFLCKDDDDNDDDGDDDDDTFLEIPSCGGGKLIKIPFQSTLLDRTSDCMVYDLLGPRKIVTIANVRSTEIKYCLTMYVFPSCMTTMCSIGQRTKGCFCDKNQ